MKLTLCLPKPLVITNLPFIFIFSELLWPGFCCLTESDVTTSSLSYIPQVVVWFSLLFETYCIYTLSPCLLYKNCTIPLLAPLVQWLSINNRFVLHYFEARQHALLYQFKERSNQVHFAILTPWWPGFCSFKIQTEASNSVFLSEQEQCWAVQGHQEDWAACSCTTAWWWENFGWYSKWEIPWK